MAETLDLLVEIGTEELPPTELRALRDAFSHELLQGLGQAALTHGRATPYATPRRLAVLVEDLLTSQPERQVERRGPALKIAFDADGNPTKAALGFARSCGVDVQQLETLENDQGSWLIHRSTEVARFTVSLIGPIVADSLGKIPVRRRMRWGAEDAQFVRPVRWVVLLFGDTVIDAEILGVSSEGSTRGHRFHHPAPLAIPSPREYAAVLRDRGYVVADLEARKEAIAGQLESTAAEVGGQVMPDEALLEEVTAMVEWPVPVRGRFDEDFLTLPSAALVATMKGHQRYFPVLDGSGELLPHFITISNIASRNPDSVRAGNERVIRPRLKDAAFFVDNDLRTPLAERLEALRGVVFQEKLGSLAEKSERVSSLARQVAMAMGEPPAAAKQCARAGLLGKCDLLTEMVGEFPELQGYMGRHYALHSGEEEAVAIALEEAYLPRFAGDALPRTPAGCAVAIAEKLDTLAGIFRLGLVPTGDKDPFALRRSALGVLRIVIESELDVDLEKLLAAAVQGYPDDLPDDGTAAKLFEFMTDRLRAYFTDQGVPADVFAAVQARRPTRPLDFAMRVRAVNEFRQRPEAGSLAAASKRIQNILRQAGGDIPDQVDDGLLQDAAEWDLAAKLVGLGPSVRDLLRQRDYTSAMSHLAGLRETIDAFFDTVTVMADDGTVRANRLALLRNVGDLFLQTADISQLQS